MNNCGGIETFMPIDKVGSSINRQEKIKKLSLKVDKKAR